MQCEITFMQITMWKEKVLQAGDGKCRGPAPKCAERRVVRGQRMQGLWAVIRNLDFIMGVKRSQ